MQTIYIITTIIFAILFIAAIIYFSKKLNSLKPEEKEDDKSMQLLQEQLKEIRQTMDYKLGESQKQIQMQFGQSAKIIKDVTERLTKLDDTNKQVIILNRLMPFIEISSQYHYNDT